MVYKHFSSIPKLSLLWVDGFDKNMCCHLVISMHVINFHVRHSMSYHVTPCVTPCQVMSCHVTPCVKLWHPCYIVDLTLLMCKLSWLLQELPVLYRPVFLEHLLTSEELQLQKQPILPLKWNDTHSQVIFCAVRCLVKISFKCLKGFMGIFSYKLKLFFL